MTGSIYEGCACLYSKAAMSCELVVARGVEYPSVADVALTLLSVAINLLNQRS